MSGSQETSNTKSDDPFNSKIEDEPYSSERNVTLEGKVDAFRQHIKPGHGPLRHLKHVWPDSNRLLNIY
jgi:hypothetical protein